MCTPCPPKTSPPSRRITGQSFGFSNRAMARYSTNNRLHNPYKLSMTHVCAFRPRASPGVTRPWAPNARHSTLSKKTRFSLETSSSVGLSISSTSAVQVCSRSSFEHFRLRRAPQEPPQSFNHPRPPVVVHWWAITNHLFKVGNRFVIENQVQTQV